MDANTDNAPASPSAPLTAAQAEAILKANYRNLVKRVSDGKPLPPSERKLLESIVSGSKGASITFAANQVDLAEALGCHRKTIQRALKREGNPGTQADGRYDVVAWREFLRITGNFEDDSDAARTTSRTEARTRKEMLQAEKLAYQISIYKKDFVPKMLARRVFAQFITAAKTRSISGVSRLVTLIRISPDTVSACELMRAEMLDIWRDMEKSEWAKPE